MAHSFCLVSADTTHSARSGDGRARRRPSAQGGAHGGLRRGHRRGRHRLAGGHALIPRRLSRRGGDLPVGGDECLCRPLNLLGGGLSSQGQAHRAQSRDSAEAHGRQHGRRSRVALMAGRPGGGGDARGGVEHCAAGDAGERDVERVRQHLFGVAVAAHAGDGRLEAPPEIVAQPALTPGFRFEVPAGSRRGGAQAGDRGHVLGARPPACSCPAPRSTVPAGCLSARRGPRRRGGVQLVPGDREEVDPQPIDTHRHLAHRLGGVRVDECVALRGPSRSAGAPAAGCRSRSAPGSR